MKRSEAEQKINTWLDNSNVITGDTILNFVETVLHMKPPGVWVNEHIYDRTSGMHGWEEFEWEHEYTCKDCGVETTPGPGSARCPACWEDKLGESV